MDSQTALKQLNDYRATTRSADDIYKQQSQELGVGASQQRAQELRNLITGTEQALRGVEGSVTGRTQGSLVSEAQRSRLANIERAPIAEQFNTQQNALSNENQTYQNLLAEASNRSGMLYGSQQDRLRSLESDYQNAVDQEFRNRQFEEQKRQFEAQMAASRAAAQKNQYDLDAIMKQLTGGQTSAAQPGSQPSLASILGGGNVGGITAGFNLAGNGSKPSPSPIKPGYTALGLAAGPAMPFVLAGGALANNKNKLNYILNNKAGYAKGLVNTVKGWF